jgi:hypothetical protein
MMFATIFQSGRVKAVYGKLDFSDGVNDDD